MDCNEARLLIDERVQGLLAPEHEARLDEHLAACAECAQDLGQLTKTRQLVATARQDLPPEGVLARVWEQIQIQHKTAQAFASKATESAEREESMSAAASLPTHVHRPPLRADGEEGPKAPPSRWKLIAVSSLLAAAMLIVAFNLGHTLYPQEQRSAALAGSRMDREAMRVAPASKQERTRAGWKNLEGMESDEEDLNLNEEMGEVQEKPTSGFSLDGGGISRGVDGVDTFGLVAPAPSSTAQELADKNGDLKDNFKTAVPKGGYFFVSPGGRPPENKPAAPMSPPPPMELAEEIVVTGKAVKILNQSKEKSRDNFKRLGQEVAGFSDVEKVLVLKSQAFQASQKAGDEKASPREGDTTTASEKLDRPKIIKTGDLTVEVKNYVEASRAADGLVVRFQGFVADSRTVDLPGGTKSGTLVIRVAPEKFEELFAELKKIGTVTQERAGGQDITAAYTDTEARIKNLQITEARLQDLIKSKNWMDKMESLLQVERELARVRGEVEAYQGQMRVWGNQISLSTIRLTLQEPTRAVPSGSLSVEVPSLTDAKKMLDASLSNAGAQLISGQTSKREDGTLMGTYTLRAKFARFGELVGSIKGLGRTQDEQIRNQPFGGAIPEGAEHVPCDLALQLFERSVQLPNGNLNLEVQGIGESIEKLNLALAAAQGSITSNQTQRQPDGTTTATLTLRVRAGGFQGLMDALPALGRVTNRVVNGEGGRIQGGAADVPCQVSLFLSERAKEVPKGQLAIEVNQFTAAREKLTGLIKEKELQVLFSDSQQRPDGRWVGSFRLGIKASRMDEVAGELEKFGRVKNRQLKGLGLGELSKIDPNVTGEVALLLEERPALVPAGHLTVEVEKFPEGLKDLSKLIKEKSLQELGAGSQQRPDGSKTGTFKLGIKAAEMDEVIGEIEKLGRVKLRDLRDVGLGELSKADPNLVGEVSISLEERLALAPQEEGAFRQTLRDTFGGFLSSMGYIVRGLGLLLPWLAIFGVIIGLVVRSQRKKEAAAALRAARTPAAAAPSGTSSSEPKESEGKKGV